MLASAVSQAEKMKMIKLMRQQMYYDIEYLRAQAEYIHTLELVMHSKRISLEELLQMLEKALKAKLAAQRCSHGDGDGNGDDAAGDGSDDSSAGASGDDGAASGGGDSGQEGDCEDSPADEGGDSGDREHDIRSDEASEGHGNGELPTTSKVAGKQVEPPVAVRRQAARRMARPMKKLPSRMAAPSASKTVPAAPALLSAWDTPDAQGSSSSDLGSSPSPAFPPVSIQRRPLLADPVAPPRRRSAAMKEKARQWLAGLPIDLPSPLSAGRAPSIEPSPVGTARVSLTGVFALNHSRELPILASGPPQVDDSAKRSEPTTDEEDRSSTSVEVDRSEKDARAR
ncbi:hypothetical protein C8Q72DRAFT_8048 [Fomitopsis betulina]|nr:hypothetical protein C8Q72DRAFT_8048 [Fomitopsis betulina]